MPTHILRHTPPLGLHLNTHKRYHVTLHTPSPIRKSIKHIYDNLPEFTKATQHLTHLPMLEHHTDLTCWEVLELVQTYPMVSNSGVTTHAPCTTVVGTFEILVDYERLHPIENIMLKVLYENTVNHIRTLLPYKDNEAKVQELLYVMERLWRADHVGGNNRPLTPFFSYTEKNNGVCCGMDARCHSEDN